jgi:hypothetical protein
MTKNVLSREITEVLILSKTMIDRIRAQTPTSPDRASCAFNILLAHDAAELALASIASHLNKLPKGAKPALMDYFESLKSLHPDEDVPGKPYFSQLNTVRINIEHKGILFDVRQWVSVGTTVYGYMSEWYLRYLGLSLDELDDSVLLEDKDIKSNYDEARHLFSTGAYREVMEKLTLALRIVFDKHPALGDFSVGVPSAMYAIKLAAFGVDSNNFLSLQQFLPTVIRKNNSTWEPRWDQKKYGHPGNWREDNAQFCLATFLDVAIKTQSAPWTPSPVEFDLLYQHKIEAIKDEVTIWQFSSESENLSGLGLVTPIQERPAVTTLKKGEFLVGKVSRADEGTARRIESLLRGEPFTPSDYAITWVPPDQKRLVSGYVAVENVKITCVPRDSKL